MRKNVKYIDRPDAIIDRSSGEEIEIYEEGDEIPATYYALISNNVAYFASMENHFDWAVDMLLEDGNEDSCIGLIVDGVCQKTWTRADVTTREYELSALASVENKMFFENISFTVKADSLQKAKELAMNELVEKLKWFGLETEANYTTHEVTAIGREYEDVWFGFDE